MVQQYPCAKCDFLGNSQNDLDRHLKKKFKCWEAPHKCKKCAHPFYSRGAYYTHQKNCQGKPQTTQEKDQQIQSLKDALAASGNLNHEIKAKQQKIINNNQTNNITINDVKNITQNIVILSCGDENIDHLKKIPFEQLKEQIAFDRDPKTHIEAFKRIRLDPEHPENHNIILTDRDSDKVHFYGDDQTWKEGDYTFHVRNAIFDTNKSLQNLIPYKQREGSEYYWNHLVRGIGGACNERNDAALKPIFEGIRDPLHQATLRLLNMETPQSEESSRENSPVRRNFEAELAIEQERTKRVAERERERTKQIEIAEREKTRQLEIQLELAKLKAASC